MQGSDCNTCEDVVARKVLRVCGIVPSLLYIAMRRASRIFVTPLGTKPWGRRMTRLSQQPRTGYKAELRSENRWSSIGGANPSLQVFLTPQEGKVQLRDINDAYLVPTVPHTLFICIRESVAERGCLLDLGAPG
jgi:hypothetical protein